jgi:lactoylglutathione lyase
MPVTLRVEHVALWVRDLEVMRQFYVDRLGGQCGTLYRNQRSGLRSHFISFAAGPRIELMSRSAAAHGRPADETTGYAHLALSLGSREQVDAFVRALADAGVTVASQPRITGDGYYEAVILDPEGNPIEITR